MLVVHPSVNANTVQELIALAKNNPGKLSFASAGNGTPPHLTGELFKVSAGIDIVHVPYKGGAPAIQDVVGGQVQMTFEVMAVLVPFIKEGKLKALAVTSKQRSNLLSKVPTMIEAGLRDFQSNSWTGLVAPAGTPQAVISILNAAVNSALRTGQVLAILEKLGAQPIGGTPEQFAALLTDEIKKWAAIAVVAVPRTISNHESGCRHFCVSFYAIHQHPDVTYGRTLATPTQQAAIPRRRRQV